MINHTHTYTVRTLWTEGFFKTHLDHLFLVAPRTKMSERDWSK